jgi:hypothetical protein
LHPLLDERRLVEGLFEIGFRLEGEIMRRRITAGKNISNFLAEELKLIIFDVPKVNKREKISSLKN